MSYLFTSQRLGFRSWLSSDLEPFGKMNKDNDVMEYFPYKLSIDESSKLIDRLSKHFDENGYTFFAVCSLEDDAFIGFIGMVNIAIDSYFTPGVEIGWRLSYESWGNGYATEGATKCLEYGFEELGMKNVYSYTPLVNHKSEHVMKKLGMKRLEDFDHPKLEKGHSLERHCLYMIDKVEFLEQHKAL